MKLRRIYLILLGFFMVGCGAEGNSAHETVVQAELTEVQTSDEHSYYRVKAELSPVEQDIFSDEMKKGMEEEWEKYNSLSQEVRMLSSHLWGLCGEQFVEWSSCEEFLGFSVENPLEDAEWLTNANHYALPLDEEKPNHVALSWYGDPDGMITEAQMQSGYLDEEVRVTLTAMVTAGENGYETEMAWADEVTFEKGIIEMKEGFPILVITPDDPGEYSSQEAYFVQENILYCISVVGEEWEAEGVSNTLEKILKTFSD